MTSAHPPDAILLIGPTGAGKTPLGNHAAAFGLPGATCRHFDFGARLRRLQQAPPPDISPGTRQIITEALTQGRLLEPHENFVALEILQHWLKEIPPNAWVILNGLPRTINQAIALEPLVQVRLVVELAARDEIILTRISTNSGGDRTGRQDDAPSAVQQRLVAYHARTKPLVDHYKHQGTRVIRIPVTTDSNPLEIWQEIGQQMSDHEFPPRPAPRLTSGLPRFLSITRAARILHDGGVVAVPTETVYGLAADAGNATAVERIFTIKQRPANDPLIVHIHDLAQIQTLATDWPEVAGQLARAFWPGPLTLILPRSPTVPDIVTAQLPTVAIRMPAHPVMREILRLCQCPLAAPSANRFGCISPTTTQHVADSLGHEPDGIVEGGPCQIGLESTIVGFAGDQLLILRPGAITAAELTRVSGRPATPYRPTHQDDIPAPGTMPRHYAPATPLAIAGTPAARKLAHGNFAHLRFGPTPLLPAACHLNLSQTGNLTEAANRLYDALRYLDQLGCDAIIIDPIPAQGIGTAINDRLRRALHP